MDFPRPSSRTTFRRLRTPLRVIAVAVALAAGAPAHALSLGNAEVTSFLGQPLQMRVPIIIDDPSDGTSQCPRIISQGGADVPTLAMGRMDIERGLTQIWLRLTTALPVDEPILRVVLEIGCTQRVRREFTLLLDPPAGLANGNVQVASSSAPRIEFGRPEVIGRRGQPLLMTVPIHGELAASLTAACVRTGPGDGTEPPRALNDARVTLIQQGDTRALRFHTPDAVNDAHVRVVAEVGCDQPLRREFVVMLEGPRLASTQDEAAPVPPPAPAKRVERPAPRVAQAPHVTLPPAPAAAPLAVEPPMAQKKPDPVANEPVRVAPAVEAKPKTDRLVLSAPDEAVRPDAPRADKVTPAPETAGPERTPDEREQVLKRLEVLAAEVKTLRAELDASARRNQELSEKARSASYGWAAAAAAALLLGFGLLIHLRTRSRAVEPAVDLDKAGPMTRILGKNHESAPAAPASAQRPPQPAMTDGGGPNTLAAIVAAHRAAHEHDTQGASTAIMVTEFGDTSQALKELYSPYVVQNAGAAKGQATPPGEADLGGDRTTLIAPPTKTEIAVDIDLSEKNTEITRQLQREYERLDLAASEKEVKDSELPTRIGQNTVPLTTKLALDLDLDISTIAQSNPPKKG